MIPLLEELLASGAVPKLKEIVLRDNANMSDGAQRETFFRFSAATTVGSLKADWGGGDQLRDIKADTLKAAAGWAKIRALVNRDE